MEVIFNPYTQWSVFLSVFTFFFCLLWMKPRFGFIPSLLFFYLSLSSIYVWMWEYNRYVTVDPYNQMALRYFSADSLLKTVLILFPLMIFSKEKREFYLIGCFLAWMFFLVNSFTIIGQFLFTGCEAVNSCGGIVGNPSISVGLMVCLLPLLIEKRWDIFIYLLAAACVVLSKASIPLGLFAVYTTIHVFMALKSWKIAGILITPLFAGGFYLLWGGALFDSSDRFMVWKYMMDAWSQPKNMIQGMGFGTYHVFSINLQHHGNIAPGFYWNTLHNNWLQLLFEGGFIAMILSVAAYISAIIKNWSKKPVFMCLVLFGLYMFFNPALNFPYPTLFGAWLFVYALRKDSLQSIHMAA